MAIQRISNTASGVSVPVDQPPPQIELYLDQLSTVYGDLLDMGARMSAVLHRLGENATEDGPPLPPGGNGHLHRFAHLLASINAELNGLAAKMQLLDRAV